MLSGNHMLIIKKNIPKQLRKALSLFMRVCGIISITAFYTWPPIFKDAQSGFSSESEQNKRESYQT